MASLQWALVERVSFRSKSERRFFGRWLPIPTRSFVRFEVEHDFLVSAADVGVFFEPV